MQRSIWIVAPFIFLAGCAVIKTTDVTDPSFKRHQSVSLFGWPVYSRVTDREAGSSPSLATQRVLEPRSEFEPAEMLVAPIEPYFPENK